MSFSSGTFSINSTGQPVVTGTVISSTVFNALTADLATGLSTCVLKDGTQTITANIPMATYKITGLGAGTARTDAASLATIQDGTGVYVGTVGGTADVITLTPSPAITAYAAGQTFRFISSGANTTNVTVNISALGAKAITKNGSTALIAGDIPSGQLIEISYDGTRFQLGAVVADRLPKSGGTVTGDITMSGASIVEAEGAAVASAGTTDIWATDGNTVHITGTTTITSFGTAPQAGAWMKVIFDDALTLTHGANLNLPGSANITTAANDFAFVYADTTTLFRVAYFKADGSAVVGASAAASQAQQETATSTTVYVSPGRQQYHPSAAKVWAVFDTVTSTTLLASYNVSSLTDDGTGVTTVNFTTAFSTANYAVTRNTGEVAIGDIIASSRVVGAVQIRTRNVAETLTDTLGVGISCFGDQ